MKPSPRELAEAAERYCADGMFVIPAHHPVFLSDGVVCSCGKAHEAGKKGKHPAVNWRWYQDKRPDAGEVHRWFHGRFSGYNIAIIHGAASGTILLDWDGLEGYATQRELERQLGELPATWTVCSGGGGSHMIYRHPGVHVPTNKGLRECFDVRGDGGISIMPPSVHEYGMYGWECDLSPDELAIADLPQPWIDLIVTSAVSTKQSSVMTNVQWQPAADGSMIIADGREQYMRDVVWSTLQQMIQDDGLPAEDDLFERAAETYLPHVDLSRPGRGPDELLAKCRAALSKVQRVQNTKRGLTRPFLLHD